MKRLFIKLDSFVAKEDVISKCARVCFPSVRPTYLHR